MGGIKKQARKEQMEGLDKHIEEQREQRGVLDRIAHPYSIAELQELAEKEDWEAWEE